MTENESAHVSRPPPPGGFGAQDPNAAPSLAPAGRMPPPPPAARTKGLPGWAIALLVLAALVFLVIGPLAALGIHGMNKFIRAAKQAEAKNSVGQMARDAQMAYEAEGTDAGALGSHRVCPSASQPIPRNSMLVSGKKYQSTDAEWTVDREQNAGFACLGFSMVSPQYYQYDYKGAPDGFTAIARGDVDGNGVYSEFRLGGKVVDGDLKIDPRTQDSNPDE